MNDHNKEVLWNAVLASVGAGGAYLVAHLADFDLGVYGPVITAAA